MDPSVDLVQAPETAAGTESRWNVGLAALLLFLFLTFSRVTDIWLPNLSLSLIAAIAALVFVFVRGRAWQAVRNPAGFGLLALTIWLGVSVPSSFWRGGSATAYLDWCKSAMVFVLIAGLVETRQNLLTALRVLAASSVLVLVQAALLGAPDNTGRLTVGQGVLSNPNDLAQLLLNGVPFLFLPFLLEGGLLSRGVGLAGVIGSLGTVGATGSRSGLLGALAVGLTLFVSQPFRRKLPLVVIFIAVAGVAIAVAPTHLVERYGTLFTSSEDVPDNEAVESRKQRLFLLQESIRLTIEHPVVGVGIGVFAAASAADADARREAPAWRDTHNSYTQVSSEAGLPALVFFLAVIGWSLQATLRAWRAAKAAGDAPLQAASYCLLLSFVGYIVICLFSSIAYHVYLPVYAGLSLVCDRLSRAGCEL